jgi:hypothetical protein
MSDNASRRSVGMATRTPIPQLTDREFFDAHPDQDIRRRPIVPGELPKSLASRNIREVEVRRVEPGVRLLWFIDADGGCTPLLPVFDPNVSSTAKGRQKIASWQRVMDAFSSFIANCAQSELDAEQTQ